MEGRRKGERGRVKRRDERERLEGGWMERERERGMDRWREKERKRGMDGWREKVREREK